MKKYFKNICFLSFAFLYGSPDLSSYPSFLKLALLFLQPSKRDLRIQERAFSGNLTEDPSRGIVKLEMTQLTPEKNSSFIDIITETSAKFGYEKGFINLYSVPNENIFFVALPPQSIVAYERLCNDPLELKEPIPFLAAHELAHLKESHVPKRIKIRTLCDLIAIFSTSFIELPFNYISLPFALTLSKHCRALYEQTQEKEADLIAAKKSSSDQIKSGIEFFKICKEQDETFYTSKPWWQRYIDTILNPPQHPSIQTRIQYLTEYLQSQKKVVQY